jgi:hypothetical protein
MARVFDETGLLGLRLCTKPDDDKIFEGIPQGHAAIDGQRIVFRETEWPRVRDALKSTTQEPSHE